MANSTTLYVGSDGRTTVDVSENKTLAAVDCGIVQNVIADAITVTLPATAANLAFTVRNGGVPASTSLGAGSGSDYSVLVKIAPNSSDGISGLAFTAATNKAAQNTKATARVGDEITIIGGGSGAAGWNVLRAKGTWAREA